MDCSAAIAMTGLKTLSSKWPWLAGKADGRLVADHLRAHHGQGLRLGRVDLSRHDRGAGLVLRQRDLAEAGARPRAHQPDVVCDLEEPGCKADQRAVREDERVVRRQGLELVRRRREGEGREFEHLGGEPVGEFWMRVEPRSDRRAALRERVKAGQGRLDPGDAEFHLRDIAREFLPKRHRGRVLQMGAADLDDVGEGNRLRFESPARGAAVPAEAALRSRARLRHASPSETNRSTTGPIDVVVRMDGRLSATRPAEPLVGKVRQDLVHVHVRLGARSRLPDRERELVVELALRHVGCRRRDRFGEGGREKPEVLVHEGCGLLDERKRLDERNRHALAADAEILQGALGLRAPKALRGNLDWAEGVGLGAGGAGVGGRHPGLFRCATRNPT